MKIRPESATDDSAIRAVHVAAFADHPFSRQTEHLIVNALREDEALTISLIAEKEGKVVGHIAFSPVWIGGECRQWFALGPVGVLPHWQRQGIGSELVRKGLSCLQELNAQGCVLVGNPAFYARFGFKHQPELTMHGVPPEVLLYLPLSDVVPQGEVEHHPAFFVTAETIS